jgi:hypothetical protein
MKEANKQGKYEKEREYQTMTMKNKKKSERQKERNNGMKEEIFHYILNYTIYYFLS